MNYERLNILIGLGLLLALSFMFSALIKYAHGGDKQLCQMEPLGPLSGWHYRTKVNGKAWKCWYEGPRMKPRSELYWAEAPVAPSIIEHVPWQLEPRFQGGDND